MAIAILRTNDYQEDFKVVKVLKNPISENNSLAEISFNGQIFWSGGILCEYNNITLNVLEKLTPKEQWDWLLSIKCPKIYV